MTELSPNDQIILAQFLALHAAALAAWIIGTRIARRRDAKRSADFDAALARLPGDGLDG